MRPTERFEANYRRAHELLTRDHPWAKSYAKHIWRQANAIVDAAMINPTRNPVLPWEVAGLYAWMYRTALDAVAVEMQEQDWLGL